MHLGRVGDAMDGRMSHGTGEGHRHVEKADPKSELGE
jgi:hypothetical protein